MIHRVRPAVGDWFDGRTSLNRVGRGVLAAAALTILMAVLAVGGGSKVPGGLGALLLVIVLGAIIVTACFRYPALAVVVMLGAMFLRLSLPHLVVADPFVIAYAVVLASAAVWMWQHRRTLPRITFVEVAMGLYVLWNYASMVLPHRYPPLTYPLNGSVTHVARSIEISTDIPFTLYLLGRRLFARESAIRFVLWSVLGFAAYSVLVSIDQFYAPSLVWPRYIVDDPGWPGRANGVFNQPVANGMVLVVGLVIALVLASDRGEPTWRRVLLWLFALPSGLAIYLTHTRAIYLAAGVALIIGVVLAKGARAVFGTLIVAVSLLIATNWSTFTSSNRDAGGVGSTSEVFDRLNGIATSIWAFKRQPWFGWGIDRFVAVNTFHHQQWSITTPWTDGLGIASHETELGILVDLGLVGLVLWLCVMVPLIGLLVQAYWILPPVGLAGRPLAVIGICALSTQIMAGSFADLRLLDFPTCMVFLLYGMAVGARDRELAVRKPRPPLWLSSAVPALPVLPDRMPSRPAPVPVGAP
jgi:O-antigen ligase